MIGSGIASLANATILSKLGKKVLVLEKHATAGGCCHTYNRKIKDNGKEWSIDYETGLHYVGDTLINKFHLNILPNSQINLLKMGDETDNYCYDGAEYPNNESYRYPSGIHNIKQYFKETFS